jgi:transposase
MSHRNAPLTPAGRLRLVQRCQYRPIAHVAAEAGVSRQCLSKWVTRYRLQGEDGLVDRSSAPHGHPGQLDPRVVAEIERLRRTYKWSARLIAVELAEQGHRVSVATVGRWLVRLGLNRRRWLDVDGEPLRGTGKIVARYRGHMVHVDVKKVGRIPDGGGWRIQSTQRAATAPSTGPPAGPRPAAPAPGTCSCTRRSTGSPGWRIPSIYPTKPPAP